MSKRSKRSKLSYLQQAIVIRALRAESDPPTNGKALSVLRAQVIAGDHDEHPVGRRDVVALAGAIMSQGIEDMPPDTDLVGVLVETLSQRLGGTGHADAWRYIGINPARGRALMARNAAALDWPVWLTLRSAALDPANNRTASA